eukprot:1156988-Pelagomonas_calceolata.AAC.6
MLVRLKTCRCSFVLHSHELSSADADARCPCFGSSNVPRDNWKFDLYMPQVDLPVIYKALVISCVAKSGPPAAFATVISSMLH